MRTKIIIWQKDEHDATMWLLDRCQSNKWDYMPIMIPNVLPAKTVFLFDPELDELIIRFKLKFGI